MATVISRCSVSVLFVILTAWLAKSDATSQHMICKTVDDVFSGDVVTQTPSRSRLIRGPAGKIGPKGEKGDSGVRGRAGKVNQRYLEAMVDEKVQAATEVLRRKIANLQSYVEGLNGTVGGLLQSDITGPPVEICDGFTYRRKCYFAVFSDSSGILLASAEQMCRERGAKLADLLNTEHEDLAQNEVRNGIKNGAWIQVWLGMTYTPSTNSITLSSGAKQTPSDYRWYDNRFPSSTPTDRNIILEARQNPGERGIFNRPPDFGNVSGALCEK